MTDWPCHIRLQKNSMTHRLLCTKLNDGISCALSPNHNIHGGKWCLSAMVNMSFEVKKCWKCIFQGSGDPIGDHHGGISPDTDLTNSKETLWEKTALDKSAWIKAYINIFIRIKGFHGITNLWRDLSSRRRLKLTHCLVESIETKGSSTNFTSSNIELI